jgi:hypothetical protein
MMVANLLAPPTSVMAPRVMRRVFFSHPARGNGSAQPAAAAAAGDGVQG